MSSGHRKLFIAFEGGDVGRHNILDFEFFHLPPLVVAHVPSRYLKQNAGAHYAL